MKSQKLFEQNASCDVTLCQRASALHARSKHVLKYSTRNATMCKRSCLTLLGIDDINKGSHKRVVSSNTTYEALCLEA